LCKGNGLLYVIMLVEKGMDINSKNNEGDTSLHLCAQNGAKENIRIIQKLLEFKADPNITNSKGENFYSLLGHEMEEKFSNSEIISEQFQQTERNKNNHLNNNFSKLQKILFYFLIPLMILIISIFTNNSQ
jgi:ankyrin repeat protein